ncbi:MAG: galactokinase [Planctomycetales bacterium]|nr:galactokinase [Planctomycetales bacterium]
MSSSDSPVSVCPFESPSLEEQIADVRAAFEKHFGQSPQWTAAAPGRVNLIGEHTDYNAGFVFPLAIERYTVVAAARPQDGAQGRVRLYSTLMDATAEFSLDDLKREQRDWTSYVRGVFAQFAAQGVPLESLDVLIDSQVPLGSGLSSSAALEVATATLLEAATAQKLDPVDKARVCQKAEHEYAGVPCGIMDQYSSALGAEGKLLLIDCRTETADLTPFDDPNVAVLVINSNVKHELTGGEYAERRAQCEEAARRMGVESLREVTSSQLERHRTDLEDIHYRRARHVCGEIERTVAAAKALRAGDWMQVGQLMYASHASLRDDYEVSCPELDALVEAARKVGREGGVIGSRMTGGGFGGCTVTLVDASRQREIADKICASYAATTGIQATPFVTRPAKGAHVVAS